MEVAPLLKSSAAAATLFNSGEAKFAIRVSSSLVSCRRIVFGRQNASFLWPVLFARPLTTDLPHGCCGSGSKRRARGPVMAAAKKASDGGIKEEGKYKHTVDLPKTTFGMRANAVVREPEIQKLWEENQVFKRVSDRNTGRSFVLHDGPPYANGNLHMGHALNKILKDIINRYKLLRNYRVNFVPGWDCHGLPIELKVLDIMPSANTGGALCSTLLVRCWHSLRCSTPGNL